MHFTRFYVTLPKKVFLVNFLSYGNVYKHRQLGIHTTMRHVYCLVVSLFVLISTVTTSCTGGHNHSNRLLCGMDTLLEDSTETAYKRLVDMKATVDSLGDRELLMRHRLYLCAAENKLFIPLPPDSTFTDVVDYFDSNGNSNDRMRAHYLLGCIHRDQNEPAEALECFLTATECADTLARDCDFTVLFSIYGQMAVLYNDQYLYEKAIEAEKGYSKFAMKAGFAYDGILGLQKICNLYYLLGDTAKMYDMADTCHRLYIENGMADIADNAYTTLIFNYLDNEDYRNAYNVMQKIEQSDGFYNEKGEITNHREYFYYTKGRYYLGIGELDSAEMYFRRVEKFGYHNECYDGLQKVYQSRHIPDSVLKYSNLYGNSIDSLLLNNRTVAVGTTADSIYQDKKVRQEKHKEAQKARKIMSVIFLAVILTFGTAIFLVVRYYRKKRKFSNGNYMGITNLHATSVVEKMRKHLQPSLYSADAIITEEDWADLFDEIKKYIPDFYSAIFINHHFSHQENKVCSLMISGFKTKEMAILLDTTTSRISTIKSKLNNILFNMGDARSLYNNFVNLLS